MKQYFRIKLHNAAYVFQLLSGKTRLSRVEKYKPCCIAENGFILGANSACADLNINVDEPLEKALLKCADLCVEAPNFSELRRYSALFLEICSRFGLAKLAAFDECLLETEELSYNEVPSFISALRDELQKELNTEADVQTLSDFSQSINPYSASAGHSDCVIELVAEILNFRLSIDNCCAKMFSMTVVDDSGITHTYDRHVDVPCGDYKMIHFVLKNMLDLTVKPVSVTVSLYDISIKQSEPAPVKTRKDIKERFRKKPLWYYTKKNAVLTEIINGKKLYCFENLCDYISNNPDLLGFEDLCAVAEKANTRRLKLGGYFMTASYAAKLVKMSDELNQRELSVLVDSYCPFSLLFILNDYCNAKLYFGDIDERTLELLKMLDVHSPFRPINLEPAMEMSYDISLSNKIKAKYPSKVRFLLVKKTFFASADREVLTSDAITKIFDFGTCGFSGSFEQFAVIVCDSTAEPDETEVISLDNDISVVQKQDYITDASLPCWVIYRNEQFDSVYSKMRFNLFNVYSGNQIKQRDYNSGGDVCVISASCIDGDGEVTLTGDCRHVTSSAIKEYRISEYVERDDVLFAAAQSSTLKVARKPKGCVPNPSTVLLIPKEDVKITDDDIDYYSSQEFRRFYDVALNHQSFMLSSDSLSQYFLGKVV